MTETQKKLIKDFVLISILINEIEEPNKVPTKEVKAVYDILKQAVEPMEKIIDKVYGNSKGIRNTTFIQDLEKKFDYNIEREVKRY
jgi:predicted DNA-binding protein YlxM (UPF0122 family)